MAGWVAQLVGDLSAVLLEQPEHPEVVAVLERARAVAPLLERIERAARALVDGYDHRPVRDTYSATHQRRERLVAKLRSALEGRPE